MANTAEQPWVEQHQFGPLGSSALAQIGEWTLNRLRTIGVALKPHDRLERAALLVRAIHEERVRITPDDPHTAELAAEAIRTVVEFYLAARCSVRPTPEIRRKFERALKGSDLPRLDKRTEPRDLQFELSVAATFALGGVEGQTAEPDLRIVRDGEVRGVAIKRVGNARRLEERVPEGVRQLRAKGLRGYVAVNVDSFLEGLPQGGTAEEAGQRFDERVTALHELLPELANEPALLGVLGVGTVVAWSFTGERPGFNLSTFLQFRDFVSDSAQRAESDAFFEKFKTRVGERLAAAFRPR